MLTITEITSRQQLGEYSEQENADNKNNAPKIMEWFGRSAATLGLSKVVSNSDFNDGDGNLAV